MHASVRIFAASVDSYHNLEMGKAQFTHYVYIPRSHTHYTHYTVLSLAGEQGFSVHPAVFPRLAVASRSVY